MKEFVFELQRFAETSQLGILETLGKIITTLDLNKLAEDLNNAKNATEWLKNNANPILNFIGKKTPLGDKFGNYAKLITGSISIVYNALAILKGNLSDAERAQKFGLISSSLESMASTTEELIKSKKLTSKSSNLWFMSIVSAGISLVANLVAGSDGITPKEKEAINRSYILFMRTLGTDLAKKIFDAATDAQFNRLLTENVMEEAIANGKFFQNASKTFTKAFGIVMTFGTGILNGVDKYKLSMKKYTDDGIPEKIAKHDAFIDALAKFIKETLSGIVVGLDDVIFSGSKWILSLFGINYAEDKEDYVAVLADYFKTLNYKNSGTSKDDKFYVLNNKSMVYGNDGDDDISNYAFSNVTMWGGHDNDTLNSYTTDSATPQNNSIFGGPGDDKIYVYDKNSTIYGGTGNDFVYLIGTNNKISGDEDDDTFYLANNANDNTINGGTGNDYIMLEDAKNTVIKYASGDGIDTVFGFNDDDSLKVSGAYKTEADGNNLKVMVGDGLILLVGAAGKNININGKTIKSGEENSTAEPLTPIKFPTLPATVASPFIYGTESDDTIRDREDFVVIQALGGNDSIYNDSYWSSKLQKYVGSSNVSIDGGDGDDYILNHYGDNTSLSGSAGNDSIYNDSYWSSELQKYVGSSNVSINGGAGNDDIYNEGSKVTINGGAGNDSIKNEGDNVTINGGDGNDSIRNSSDSVTIDSGMGNDSIYNDSYWSSKLQKYVGGSNVSINGGDGNDTLWNEGDHVTISGGAGNDSIYSWGANSKIDGGAGNDDIENSSDNVTIDGGAGNDRIYNDSYWDSKLQKYVGSSNVSINGGDGNDSIKNVVDNVTINGGEGDDTLSNKYGEQVIIDGGSGDDFIKNDGYWNSELRKYIVVSNVSINGGEGDDSLHNSSLGSNVTIDGDAGNDSIRNNGSKVTISGGTDSDTIYNNCYRKDDGTIVRYNDSDGSSVLFQYSSGDGNDIIYGFKTDSTLQIGDGSGTYSTQASGSNVIVIVGNGSISLVGAASLSSLNIVGTKSTVQPTLLTVTDKTNSPVTVDSAVKTIDASSRTNAVKITGNSLANLIIGGSGADTLWGGTGNDTLSGGNGDDVFIYSAGNDVITDYASGDKISLGAAVSKSSVSGSDVIFTLWSGSLTIKNAKGKSLSMIDSAGKSFSTVLGGSNSSTLLTVSNSTKSPVTVAADVGTIDASKRTKAVKITGNDFANTISGGSANDSLYGGAGNDSIVGNNGSDKLYGQDGSDTLRGGNGNDTLTGGNGEDVFIYSAGKDVITDYASGDKISLGAAISKTSIKGSDVVFTIGKGSLTVKNGTDKNITVIDKNGNESIKKYSTTLTVTNSTKSPVTVAADVGTIDASKRTKAVKITGNELANTINGGSANDSLYGNAGNDSILGNAGNDRLYGQDGADTLGGGNGNDILTGGNGVDVFIYSVGKDVIEDYATEDKISLGSVISKASISGSDVIFTIGKGSLTVKNGTDKNITVIDKNGNESIKKYSTTLTVTNLTKSPVTVDSAIKIIDASSRTSAVKITGNALANTINGGSVNDSLYGGSGNDSILGNDGNDKLYGEAGNDILKGGKGNNSLWGGAGNDTLWSDTGNDTFVYTKGDGKDVICGFDNNDMLKITGTFSTSYNKSKKEIAFKVGSTANAITLKDFSTTTFNINGSNYKISGSKLVKK